MTVSEKEWKELKRKEKLLKKAAEIIRVQGGDVPRVVKRFQVELEEMKKQIQAKT